MRKTPEPFGHRLARFLNTPLGLPVRLAVAGFGRIKRLFVTPRSTSELRVDEKARQAGIRRELRGLSADHDVANPRSGQKP